MPRRLPHLLFAVYVLLALAALVWPVLSWVGSEPLPLVLGMPPALAWHVLWVVLGFVALLVYDHVTGGEGGEE